MSQAKNIVICCDGTGKVIGSNNTNVVKLIRCIQRDHKEQFVFYDPGLGTMEAPGALTRIGKWITKVLGLGLGFGIHQNIREGYTYLMEHYRPGDKIFMFGFSRGAYTVCALAGVLRTCGLLEHGSNNLVDLAIKMYQKSRKGEQERLDAALFKHTFGRTCKPHFLGIWDTVASVGLVMDGNPFPSANANPDVTHVRHAVSIDERRLKFNAEQWVNQEKTDQDVKEVWFAGVHTDVGGGYDEEESGLSKITLRWMLNEAESCGLILSEHKCKETLGLHKVEGYGISSTSGKENPISLPKHYYDKVVAPDYLGILHNSLRGFYVFLDLMIGLFTSKKYNQPREIPGDADVHISVLKRWQALHDSTDTHRRYNPENLASIIERLPGNWENELAKWNDKYYIGEEGYNEYDVQADNLPSWVIKTAPFTYGKVPA